MGKKLPTLNHPPPHSDLSMRRTQINSPERCAEEGRDETGEGTVRRVGVSRFAAKSLKRLMYLKDLCCHNVLVHKSPKHLILSVQSLALGC